MNTKRCTRCKTQKSISSFHKRKNGKHRSWCIECEREACLDYYYKKKAGYIYVPKTLEERFWNMVDKKSNEECWNWLGAVDGGRYGKIGKKGKFLKSHRVSYTLHFGDIPKGKLVLHYCDNPSCVNPEHLWLGTHQDNRNDMIKKNRHIYGERSGNSKITEIQALEIISLYKEGKMSQSKIASLFNLSQSHVGDIVRGKRWKHLQSSQAR